VDRTSQSPHRAQHTIIQNGSGTQNYTTEIRQAARLGVLLADVLVQHDAEVREQLLLAALLHHDRDARDEVRRLLPRARQLVVQPPLDRAVDLRQVRLRALAEARDDGAKAVEQHGDGLVLHLLLVRVQRAVDEQLLEARGNVGSAERADDLHGAAPRQHTSAG
jgi:hypothetical protein